jgi:Ca-activated chloride channel family protein
MIDSWVSFERPEALLLLATLPALAALYVLAFVTRRRALREFGGIGRGLVSWSVPWQIARNLLRLAGLAALIVAVAGPRLGQPVERRDVVVLLDVSQSMAAEDVKATRLARAREVIDQLVAGLHGQRIGLVYYAGDARVRFPLTDDTPVVGKVLNHAGYPFTPVAGSSIEAGLRAAVDAFPPDVLAQGGPKSLVLLSDGEGLGNSPAVGGLQSRDVRVFAVGIGTAQGAEVPAYAPDGRFVRNLTAGDGPVVSKLDAAALEGLASVTGGRYWTYTGSEPVPHELSTAILNLPPTQVIGERWVLDYQRRWLLLALALGILLLEAVLPERRRMPTPAVAV